MTFLLTLMLLTQSNQHGHHPNMPKQGGLPPGQGGGDIDRMPGQGGNVSPAEQCQFDCAREMRNCTMPAAPRSPGEANNEDKRKSFMAASKDCMKKTTPCFQKCEKMKGADKAGDQGKAESKKNPKEIEVSGGNSKGGAP
ncbi:MAG: hypothetical protein JNK82_28990 [Myxococcaceae bacterium]|nr:hypothetical protein [Myxococcaceae bacterium]